MQRFVFAIVLTVVCSPSFCFADISLTTGAPTYTQNFNSLATTGNNNSLNSIGWQLLETGTNANQLYRGMDINVGVIPQANSYSFAWATSTSDRALGGLRGLTPDSTFAPTFGAAFKNDSLVAINSLAISYRGEQYFRGGAQSFLPDRLDFQYSLDATSLSTGVWVNANQLDFGSPQANGAPTAYDGNFNGNFQELSATLTGLNIDAGKSIWIRWSDFDLRGVTGADLADDGLAIDDFAITAGFAPAAVPEPTTTAALLCFGGVAGVSYRLRRRSKSKAA